MKAIILAAGSGRRLKIHKPKGMLNIGSKPLIDYSVKNLRASGIDRIKIVTGYQSEFYNKHYIFDDSVNLVHNREYANSGSLYSLYVGITDEDEDVVILDSDILYNWNEVNEFINSPHRNSIFATNVPEGRTDACYLKTDYSDTLVKISKNMNTLGLRGEDTLWEHIGITKVSGSALAEIRAYAEDKFLESGDLQHEYDYAFESIETKFNVLKYKDYIWAEADDNQQLQYMVSVVYPKITIP